MRFTNSCVAASLLLASAAFGNDLERVSWLAGGWRVDMGNIVIEEHWIPSSGGMMLGVSQSIAEGKVVAFEFLRIEVRGTDIFYIAQPSGRPGTEFELRQWSIIDLRFQNPEHDHPKLIHYRLQEDGALRVQIQGDEGEQAWEFQRINSP